MNPIKLAVVMTLAAAMTGSALAGAAPDKSVDAQKSFLKKKGYVGVVIGGPTACEEIGDGEGCSYDATKCENISNTRSFKGYLNDLPREGYICGSTASSSGIHYDSWASRDFKYVTNIKEVKGKIWCSEGNPITGKLGRESGRGCLNGENSWFEVPSNTKENIRDLLMEDGYTDVTIVGQVNVDDDACDDSYYTYRTTVPVAGSDAYGYPVYDYEGARSIQTGRVPQTPTIYAFRFKAKNDDGMPVVGTACQRKDIIHFKLQ
jgi:hypothetical protein